MVNEKERKVERSPLIEVALCLDVAGVPNAAKERIERLEKVVAPSYKYDSDILEGSASFNPTNPTEAAKQYLVWKGMRFKCENNVFIVANLDQQIVRFGYSRLMPYESWEVFTKEGMRLMQQVREFYKVDFVVKRIGVRSVNRINLSGGAYPLDAIFRNPPANPTNAKRVSVDELFIRESSRYLDYDGLYATTVKFGRKRPPNVLECYFDTDVFSRPNIEWSQVEFEVLLGKVRALKDDLFFGSVTDLWMTGNERQS